MLEKLQKHHIGVIIPPSSIPAIECEVHHGRLDSSTGNAGGSHADERRLESERPRLHRVKLKSDQRMSKKKPRHRIQGEETRSASGASSRPGDRPTRHRQSESVTGRGTARQHSSPIETARRTQSRHKGASRSVPMWGTTGERRARIRDQYPDGGPPGNIAQHGHSRSRHTNPSFPIPSARWKYDIR